MIIWVLHWVVILILSIMVLYLIIEKKKTEKKRVVEYEMESATLNAMFDSIPDLMFCKDLEFKHLRINKRYEELFHVNRNNVLGKTDKEALDVPDEIASLWRRDDAFVISEQVSIKKEDIVPVANGTFHIFETIKVPLIVDGKSIGILGVARDVTTRKEMENDLLSASEAKSVFLANMSHEIRTPMNSIIGFSELAIEEEVSPKVKKYLEYINENSNWLLQIINDILDLSKIEAGKLELEHIPFNLQDVFKQCQYSMNRNAEEKGISLNFHIDFPDGTLFMGDPVRLCQVIINLISNAIKFTESGSVDVSSHVTCVSEHSRQIYCEIKDTGIGMTSEQIAKASEPFVQADVSITRKFGGTGLGIPIVKNLLEKMGGLLNINSTPNEGSTFSFNLTFETTNELEKLEYARSLTEIEKPYFKGEVLVCEDSNMNQIVITDYLSRVGLNVCIAENGLIGVNMVKERMDNPFDLIFMDIQMPVMGGLEATAKILEMGSKTPIIALTANIMTTDQATYKKSGMKTFLGKPFTSKELWRCLLTYLSPIDPPDKEYEVERTDLVNELCTTFYRENLTKFDKMIECIENNDIRAAYLIVHTLKSSAGFVGKLQLQTIAAEIEMLLTDNTNRTTKRHWDMLEDELGKTLEEFKPLFESTTQEQIESFTDPKEIRETLDELEVLLRNRKPESLNMLNKIRAIPGAESLATFVETYDFKQAHELLIKIKGIWRSA